MEAIEHIQQLRDNIKAAEKELWAAMIATYKMGTRVKYKHGAYTIACTVTGLEVGYGGHRVHVRGFSGKEYWISGYRLWPDTQEWRKEQNVGT